MESKQINRKVVFAVVALITVLVAAIAASIWFAGNVDAGTLIIFDDDYSDSVLGWAIAVPILILTAILVALILAGTGVMVLGALAMAVVVAIVAVVFALLVAFLPLGIFVAIPILAVIGLVKLMSKPASVSRSI